MAGKPKNTIPTVTLTLSTTQQIRDVLEAIAESGFHGKNPSEVAERIISGSILDMIQANHPLVRGVDVTAMKSRAGPD